MNIAELRGVTKRYGEVVALRDIDLDIRRGELFGLLKPNKGAVEMIERNRIGAMLQVAKVPETLRVREHIDLFSSYYPSPLPMRQVIEAAGLTGLENRQFGELSGGQR